MQISRALLRRLRAERAHLKLVVNNRAVRAYAEGQFVYGLAAFTREKRRLWQEERLAWEAYERDGRVESSESSAHLV